MTETSTTFGLGNVPSPKLTKQHELAILEDMGWDGQSIPFPILKAWFEKIIGEQLEAVLESHTPRNDLLAKALSDAEFYRTVMPEKAVAASYTREAA